MRNGFLVTRTHAPKDTIVFLQSRHMRFILPAHLYGGRLWLRPEVTDFSCGLHSEHLSFAQCPSVDCRNRLILTLLQMRMRGIGIASQCFAVSESLQTRAGAAALCFQSSPFGVKTKKAVKDGSSLAAIASFKVQDLSGSPSDQTRFVAAEVILFAASRKLAAIWPIRPTPLQNVWGTSPR